MIVMRAYMTGNLAMINFEYMPASFVCYADF